MMMFSKEYDYEMHILSYLNVVRNVPPYIRDFVSIYTEEENSNWNWFEIKFWLPSYRFDVDGISETPDKMARAELFFMYVNND